MHNLTHHLGLPSSIYVGKLTGRLVSVVREYVSEKASVFVRHLKGARSTTTVIPAKAAVIYFFELPISRHVKRHSFLKIVIV